MPIRYKNSIIAASDVGIYMEKKVGRETTRIRTVQYKYSDGSMGRIVEKRRFYENAEGGEKTGPRLGFNANDIDVIVANVDRIKTDLALRPEDAEIIKKHVYKRYEKRIKINDETHDVADIYRKE